MARLISEKTVSIRKQRVCEACYRTFPSGVLMNRATCAEDQIYHWYSCMTCKDLMTRFPKEFEGEEGFEIGCVADALDGDIDTPEKLRHLLEVQQITTAL